MSLFGCYICDGEDHDEAHCPERGETVTELIGAWTFRQLNITITHTYDDWDDYYTHTTEWLTDLRDGTRAGQHHSQQLLDVDTTVRDLNRIWWQLHRPANDTDDSEQLTLEQP